MPEGCRGASSSLARVAFASAPRLLALHGVRLKGFAEPPAVAALWDLDEAEVAADLERLGDDGHLVHREGRITGWSLTPGGRAHHEEQIAAELEEAGARACVTEAYRGFLRVNPELLATCTAWQLRTTPAGQVVNDHTDHAYDAEVVTRLCSLHDAAQPVLGELASTLERFARYPRRLHHAVRRVRDGAVEWFTKPLLDSYHTVWFELHEDLLSTLGLQRGSEGRTAIS